MEPTHSTRRSLPSTGISLSWPPCTTSSGAVSAAARCGIVSPTPISALAMPGGQLAVVHQRVGLVRGDHLGVAGDRVGGQFLDRQSRQHAADHLGDGDHHRRHRVLGVHRRPGQHHRRVVVGVLDAVGEDDAAAHAVAEHDALEFGMRGGGDADEVVEVVGVLGDVLQVHPLAAGTAVAAMVERIGDADRPRRTAAATWS